MRMNAAGLALLKGFESLHDGDPETPGLEPLRDPVGIWTLGWGAIWDGAGRRVTAATPAISQDEADALLRRDLGHAEQAVAAYVTAPLTANQFAALVDFAYNVGSGMLRASTLRARINRGDPDAAAEELPKWRRAGGRVLPGLVRRRAAELALWSEP